MTSSSKNVTKLVLTALAVLSLIILFWLSTNENSVGGIDKIITAPQQEQLPPLKKIEYASPLYHAEEDEKQEQHNTEPESIASNKLDIAQNDVMALTPIDAYNKYIESAESGNAKDQYYIGAILRRCQGSVITPEKIDRIAGTGRFDNNFINSMKETMNQCKDLWKLVGEKDIDELRQAWIQEAADNGLTLAKLRMMFELPVVPPEKNMLPMIYKAFEESEGNVFLTSEAYRVTSMYMANVFPDWRGFDRDAWEYLRCQKTYNCNSEATIELYSQHYHKHEVEMIIKKSEEYSNLVSNRMWEELSKDFQYY